MSPRVRSTWAMGCPSWPNRLSHSAINLPCPIAANAYANGQYRKYLFFVLACLFSGETFWTRRHGHALQADADRAGADEHDFVPCRA